MKLTATIAAASAIAATSALAGYLILGPIAVVAQTAIPTNPKIHIQYVQPKSPQFTAIRQGLMDRKVLEEYAQVMAPVNLAEDLTVLENLFLGEEPTWGPFLDESKMRAKAREVLAKVGSDVDLDTPVYKLRVSEKQLVEIAKAISQQVTVLILDEPTAALDTESEQLVMEALERLMKGRTVITIAHRLSTIRDADKIVVLKGGVVAEQGTHDELLARNGVYAELYKIQFSSPPSASPVAAVAAAANIPPTATAVSPVVEQPAGPSPNF